MISVLVVDDSPVIRDFIAHLLAQDPVIRIAGTVSDGEAAVEAAYRLRPDVITMDIHMPRLDGIAATRRIMETCPAPIIIVSGSTTPEDLAMVFRATEAGAVACLFRPEGPNADELIRTVKLMAEVKVVKRWKREVNGAASAPPALPPENGPVGLVAIGASTGGPPVLQHIFRELAADFPSPLLVVQHMAPGFLQGFSDWLSETSALPVGIASHGEALREGRIYLAPDHVHMKVTADGRIHLTDDPPVNGLRPSVDTLFASVARIYGARSVGVLLTGMGSDGALELKRMRDRGAITLAQDKETSVVHGMPGAAIALGAASRVLPAEHIATVLNSLASAGMTP